MPIRKMLISIMFFLIPTGLAAAQGANQKITIPLSDPSRPATVKVHLIAGGITVRGYEGTEVLVGAVSRGTSSESESARQTPQGMKRIPMTSPGIKAVEDNNVVEIESESFNQPVDFTIQVPRKTSLKLATVNDGDILVENVEGEIEANDINGSVTLTNVAGSVVAHALNGDVTVTMTSVAPDKPMSFSSMNGKIDVTFPPSIKADVAMKTTNGEIFTDFDIQIKSGQPAVQESKGQGGRFVVKIDRTVYGTINGGGPEYQFKNFNDDIYIRAGK